MATSSKSGKDKSFVEKLVDIVHSAGQKSAAGDMTETIFQRQKAATDAAIEAGSNGEDSDEAYQKRLKGKK